MQQMINGYVKSCELAKNRIKQLTEMKTELEKQGRKDMIGELDLERRIKLLYKECEQMQEIITYLGSYARRTGKIGET